MISSADAAVQIKLIIMYSVGVVAMLSVLGFVIHRQKKWFNKFSTPVMVITIIMALILIDTITLP